MPATKAAPKPATKATPKATKAAPKPAPTVALDALTLTALRARAREQQVPRYTRLNREELIAALTRSK